MKKKWLPALIFLSAIPLAAFFAPGDLTLSQASISNKEDALFLKYQTHEGDFLIFYDSVGSILLMRYRRDRWDYDQDALRDSLRRSITYRVRCRNLKKLPEGEIPAGITGSDLPRVPAVRKIRQIRELFLCEFGSVSESSLRDLRY